jgi:hypothetical protein
MGDPQEDVSLVLMQNGSRMKPAKRGAQKVSADNHRGNFKYEPKLVRKIVDRQRKQEYRKRNRRESLRNAANAIPMKQISTMFAQQHAVCTLTLYPSVFHFLEPLFPVEEDSIDSILDEALADYGTDLIARDHEKAQNSRVSKHDVRARLHDFKVSQEKTANVKGAILANTFLKFEEYVRLGDGDGKGGYSELKAGRIIAKTMFTRESGKVARKKFSQNRINRKYWYRYRARSIITDFRYFVATGCLLPETRGKCQGKSLIHIPNVKHYCLEIIGQLGATWSARTFRDKISAKLYSLGYLKENNKIGRSTATYFLRQVWYGVSAPEEGDIQRRARAP